mmetsp:Transcript_35156/g.92293  ORF Transcript_35156/g.92293 Transcript_35156/m.92293 type:complete len:243 (-) Transcript_35156:56-784(-)
MAFSSRRRWRSARREAWTGHSGTPASGMSYVTVTSRSIGGPPKSRSTSARSVRVAFMPSMLSCETSRWVMHSACSFIQSGRTSSSVCSSWTPRASGAESAAGSSSIGCASQGGTGGFTCRSLRRAAVSGMEARANGLSACNWLSGWLGDGATGCTLGDKATGSSTPSADMRVLSACMLPRILPFTPLITSVSPRASCKALAIVGSCGACPVADSSLSRCCNAFRKTTLGAPSTAAVVVSRLG